MNLRINKKIYRDKVLACWLGKNIGGTMGAPFEGLPDLNDVKGFTTPKGEPIPNDDLDLQLVWLRALEKIGPVSLTSTDLAWYWQKYIIPDWHEYGTSKDNFRVGFMPPMSGEFQNIAWKHSNGAWIRSEIWACITPGMPNIAAKYAIMDASVDHGISEGTVAEIFTATMESIAFVESDIRAIIEKALTFIPEDSRVSQEVRFVLESYDKGATWLETREEVVKRNSDLRTFQAPANLAFVIIGLLYGEGDFLKSMTTAINCGDDTDCTAATLGSIMGIIGGTAGIPADLLEYVGDRIAVGTVDTTFDMYVPNSCENLTDRILRITPAVLNKTKFKYISWQFFDYIYTEYTEDPRQTTLLAEWKDDEIKPITETEKADGSSVKFFNRMPYSYDIEFPTMTALVEYLGEPRLAPAESLELRVTFENTQHDPQFLDMNVILPEGWTAEYQRAVDIHHDTGAFASRPYEYETYGRTIDKTVWNLKITAGENLTAINRITVQATINGLMTPNYIPITILG